MTGANLQSGQAGQKIPAAAYRLFVAMAHP